MDTKIDSVSLKKILKWVSKTDGSGFNPIPDIEKGLKLEHKKAEQIYAYLKQNGYIQHIGGLSPLYSKTSKVVSDLNAMRLWYDKLTGKVVVEIIIGVIIIVIGAVVLRYIRIGNN